MSRSFKKRPFTAITLCKSDKAFKKISKGKFRTLERNLINSGKFDNLPQKPEELHKYWYSGKEYKFYFGKYKYDTDMEIKNYYKELIRK